MDDMQLGRVVGTATSTVKHPTFQNERLLVVQLETSAGRPDGEPILAFDRLGAGRGDRGAGDQRRPRASRAARTDHTGALERHWACRTNAVLSREESTMRIAEVIGRVTLSRFNPQLRGGRFLIALPMPLVGPDRRLARAR